MIPGATYRVQLNPDFGFEETAALVPYLRDLGITHLYCSPYLQAVPGSTHGYDIADPTRLSQELGGVPGHTVLVEALRRAGIGQVLDIVPNHMAADPTNPWWWDVLEKGSASRWAGYFDIDWAGGGDGSHMKVLVPILGHRYEQVRDDGELEVERVGGRFQLAYHQHRLPLSPTTVRGVLSSAFAGHPPLAALVESESAVAPSDLSDLVSENENLAGALDDELDALNSNPDRLDELIGSQHYRLAHWRVANEEVDYRRFFNIETLIGVRVEDPTVFADTHRLVLQLVRDGSVSGLRVDHIDGLHQPAQYLQRLSEQTDGTYLVVEKILEDGESLPGTWPVAGTTGYDFLGRVNQLFIDSGHEPDFDEIYASFTGEVRSYPELVYQAKREVMAHELVAEVSRLTSVLLRICSDHPPHRERTSRDLMKALTELVAGFEVYRTYVEPGGIARGADRATVAGAVTGAIERSADPELMRFVGRLATGDQRETETERDFTQRLQQLTGPVMAKSVEDRAFYRFNRFVSLNEVGCDPGVFGRPVESFHEATAAVADDWPHTMLTLTTHDTKRSADLRARLNVLSEIPGPWRRATEAWAAGNDGHRRDGWPDANTEYLLYQTLVGAWPIDAERMVAYMLKATREAGVHTSWVEPNPDFEVATAQFVESILQDRTFVDGLGSFLGENRLVERGRRNSLAQVALAMTVPGVPDIYQGDELWNLSLVDPDNRRPVDFLARQRALDSIGSRVVGLADDVLGIHKMQLLHALLQHRNEHPDLADSGRFEPIDITGPGSTEVAAFRRNRTITVVAVRSAPELNGTVELPGAGAVDVLTGVRHDGGPHGLKDVLADSPVAVLAEPRS